MKKSKNYILYRKLIVVVFLINYLFIIHANAQYITHFDSVFVEKAYPFLNFLKSDPKVLRIIQEDKMLTSNKLEHFRRIKESYSQCTDVSCYATLVKWNPREINEIGNRLVTLCQEKKEIQQSLVAFKESGPYKLYVTKSDTAFIRALWIDSSTGINKMLDVYIGGNPPLYPVIDGIINSYKEDWFQEVMLSNITDLLSRDINQDLFFEAPLWFALKALSVNERDEAVRYEPLDQGINKSACERINNVEWQLYPYSLILVPGHGPEQNGVAIDSTTISRCQLAAKCFNDNFAPFLVVSGGHVHPNKTPFCESVEMKKYMIKELNIPDSAIFIEPHARHTTTNLRNAGRIVYQFNIPDSMKILTVTDSLQNSYIILRMGYRSIKELGYIPYRNLKKISETESEFYPVPSVLQPNPLDPLDP